nr:unnamed protein product [Digitaria exilis]
MRGHHNINCANSRPPTPMGPLHLPTKRTKRNTTNQPPPPATQGGSHMRRLQGGHDASGAAVARPKWTRFSPLRPPCRREYGASQWCPNGRTTPRCAATIATDRTSPPYAPSRALDAPPLDPVGAIQIWRSPASAAARAIHASTRGKGEESRCHRLWEPHGLLKAPSGSSTVEGGGGERDGDGDG